MLNVKRPNVSQDSSGAAEPRLNSICPRGRGRPYAAALRGNPLRLWRLRQVVRTKSGEAVKMTMQVAADRAHIPLASWNNYESYTRLPSTAAMAIITQFTGGEVTGAAMVAAHSKFHSRAVQG